MNPVFKKVMYPLFFGLMLFLSFNKHSKDKQRSYHDVIWADAAGYYVYNTIWFVYGNNAAAYPDSMDVKTGDGFSLDKNTNRVTTKYPCGTAILQSPFFLTAHLIASSLGYKKDGFSEIYSYLLYVSGMFYCFMAMLLLIGFLKRHFSSFISIASVIVLFAASNLFYYTIDAPGMSHIYSFFVFSCIIYLTPLLLANKSFNNLLLFFSLVVLALLIRPTNAFIALFPLFYNVYNSIDFRNRIRFFLEGKISLLLSLLFSLIIAVPQMVYWKSTFGHFISYGYRNERFDFWKNPKLIEVWFSAMNGLFIYTPLVLLCLLGVIIMLRNKDKLGIYIGLLFFLISYIFASWWNWWFGCAFGARSFVEYYSLLIIPFCYLWQFVKNRMALKITFFAFIAFCCFINLSIEYYYDGCFYGNTWDYDAFFKLIVS